MPDPIQIVENYEEIVRRSGLVPKDRLESLVAELSQTGCTDSQILAKRLEEDQLVTPWQNNKLMRGCYKGFFLGRYKLLARLGSGGTATVYLGEHTLMRRRVAIKVLHPELTETLSYLERFYRESRVAAVLDHPNIVRALDVDCCDGHNYLVMEYVDGPTLKEYVDQHGTLNCEQAVEFIRQAALGLEEAHRAGLVHRDVKPGNLIVSLKNTIKLMDLGMALECDEAESLTLKHNEALVGTADYLAPEQAMDSHTVDARADVYALGGTLYFALTGHPPFNEGTMAVRLMKHQTEEPPSIKLDRPDCPDALIEIVSKMMAKKRKKRYQDMGEVVAALEQWLDDYTPDAAAQLVFEGGDDELLTSDEDTMTDVDPFTLIGEGNELGIGRAVVVEYPTAEGRVKLACPHCQSTLVTVPPSEKMLCKCPSCSGVMIVPGASDLAAPAAQEIPTLDAEIISAPNAQVADPAPLTADAAPSVAAIPDTPPAAQPETPTSQTPAAAAPELQPAAQPELRQAAPPEPQPAAPLEPPQRPPRPADIADWKFRDMVSALFDGDRRFVECIVSMSVNSGGKESFAELLNDLLKAAMQVQRQRETPLPPHLILTVITALGTNLTKPATLSLGRVVLGYIDLGPNDTLASDAAICAMAANPTTQREEFLANALANAEQARPEGRGRYTSSELRTTIARVFQKRAPASVRTVLQAKLNQPNLSPAARTAIQQILQTP